MWKNVCKADYPILYVPKSSHFLPSFDVKYLDPIEFTCLAELGLNGTGKLTMEPTTNTNVGCWI